MPRFMLNREILQPDGYAERSCLLIKYRLPFLRHCFVLCHEPIAESADASPVSLMEFFMSEATRLACEATGDAQAFMLIHSGSSIRKRSNWHLHVFVVQHRRQKAWVYLILGIKNFALALYDLFRKALGLPIQQLNQSLERIASGGR